MNIYPAMKARMGSWDYFVVKMSMRELADNVKFAADIYDDRTLDEAVQRVLNKSRVKQEIVTYLVGQRDRFFSSVVVAALEGNPKWFPVTMEDDERFVLFRDDPRLRDTFGLLSFDGKQSYYALDGQHRLCAIKSLVDSDSDVYADAPEGFKDEEISVIVVIPSETEPRENFLERYRRLFGNLNRYAKPMDQVTNIIMDEDDAFAIVTRRLITEHEFFRYSGRQRESARVKMEKGKNLRSTDSFFTSLEALYSVNRRLLSSRKRRNNGWNEERQTLKEFQRFRPSEEFLDELFREITSYWDGLISALPLLKQEPSRMRNHAANSEDDTQDSLLFWPIGQELLADIARNLLDKNLSDSAIPTPESILESLKELANLEWDLHRPPWRNLLLIPQDSQSKNWKIRSEERQECLKVAMRLMQWQVGLEELAEDEIEELREDWSSKLLPAMKEHVVADMWGQVQSITFR